MQFETFHYRTMHTHADKLVLEDWVAHLTYKPGTTLFVSNDFGGELSIRLSASVFDTYAASEVLVRLDDRHGLDGRSYGSFSGPLIKAQARWAVPPYYPEDGELRFRRWLKDRLVEWETHEACEWFKEVGTVEPIFDPHRSDRGV